MKEGRRGKLREISTRSSNCDIKNEVERLVEWRVISARLRPRILRSCAPQIFSSVDANCRARCIYLRVARGTQTASGPHVLAIKGHREDLQQAIVNVSIEIFLAPLQAVNVEVLAPIASPLVEYVARLRVHVRAIRETPMDRGDDHGAPAGAVDCGVVAAGFEEVDLAASGPCAVDRVFRHHPDRENSVLKGFEDCVS